MSGGYMSRQIFTLTIIILISTNSLAFSRGELQLDSSQISFHTPYSLTSITVDALLSKYSIVQNYPYPFNPEININFSFKEVENYPDPVNSVIYINLMYKKVDVYEIAET